CCTRASRARSTASRSRRSGRGRGSRRSSMTRMSAARRLVCSAALVFSLAAPASAAPLPRAVTLSAGWRFQPDPLGIGIEQGWQQPGFDRAGWRDVRVPSAWDAYDATMDGYEGVCWYAYKMPAERIDGAAWQRLRFGRANHKATVWIDGEKVAEDSLDYL